MFRQVLLFCVTVTALFGFVQTSSADLVGYWPFDEGAGDIARDLSGNGYDGTIYNATWVPGKLGSALDFDGSTAYVDIPAEACSTIGTQLTIAFWTYIDFLGSQWPFTFGAYTVPANNEARAFSGHLPWADGNIYFDTGGTAAGGYDRIVKAVQQSEYAEIWAHWAFVKNADTGEQKIYRNGVLWHSGAGVTRPLGGADVTKFTIGCKPSIENFYTGMIDDVQLYNTPLTEVEILAAMQGIAQELAGNPSPEDGVDDVLRDVVLEWTPGEFAATHDVYLGTILDDVTDASAGNPLGVLVSQGQADTTYDPGILDFGQTYFWRVDEVNGPPDNTVFKGDVWRFEVEPFAIPVEAITATASSSNADNMGPENTINGVGLNELDQHSTEATEMWLSGMGDPSPTIQYAFDKPYKLHQMWVWNSNQLIEAFIGIGAKDVTIEYSLDGFDWVTLEGVPEFAQAPGSSAYTANTVVAFGGALAQQVRITVHAGWGMLPQYGLSEVRFLYVPTFAREPQPADGQTTEDAVVELSWRAGREAASHQVFLGTDAGALDLAGTVSDSTYTATTLNYATTYYWQVVEVNEAEAPTAHTGPVWSFTTPAFFVVDDFEAYDDECERIFFTWLDGIGHNGAEECGVNPYNGNGTGSIVGNSLAPFAEQTIVHGGSQSMPLEYDSGLSETTFSLPGQDWAGHGIKSLSLFIHGTSGNTGQLYLKINNTKVAYNGDAGDMRRPQWRPWIVDLSTVGGNLQNVTSLTIGVENASGVGMLYVDDIALYPLEREMITPTDPDTAGLVALFEFEGNTNDSIGGNHGTAVNDPTYAGGAMGQAISLDGFDDYVQMANNSDLQLRTTGTYTVSANVNLSSLDHQMLVYHGLGCSTWASWYLSVGGSENGEADGMFVFGVRSSNGGTNSRVATTAMTDTWVQLTATYDGSNLKLYVDGVEAASLATSIVPFDSAEDLYIGADPGCDGRTFCTGLIDEVLIYTRALSPGEVLGLAGKTAPVVKPF